VVQARADDIVGLLNGVDNSVWNPRSIRSLPPLFGGEHVGKAVCRTELLKRSGFATEFKGRYSG
jgi:starch synthase